MISSSGMSAPPCGGGDLSTYRGQCFLGIDAGSTTTKVALIGMEGELLYSFYAGNPGQPH